MTPEQKQAISPEHLAGYSGSDNLFEHWGRKSLVMTDGIQHVTQNGLAWFVDIIASVQHLEKLRGEDFQSWKLRKDDGSSSACVVTCDDGNDNVLYSQAVEFTDYPFDRFAAYAVADGEGRRVIMLPGEY